MLVEISLVCIPSFKITKQKRLEVVKRKCYVSEVIDSLSFADVIRGGSATFLRWITTYRIPWNAKQDYYHTGSIRKPVSLFTTHVFIMPYKMLAWGYSDVMIKILVYVRCFKVKYTQTMGNASKLVLKQKLSRLNAIFTRTELVWWKNSSIQIVRYKSIQ